MPHLIGRLGASNSIGYDNTMINIICYRNNNNKNNYSENTDNIIGKCILGGLYYTNGQEQEA